MTTAPVSERLFPVLLDSRTATPDCPRSIPWSILEPFEDQAKRNHGGQSLEVLASRGGLAPDEIMAVVERRRWRIVEQREAEEWLIDLVASGAPCPRAPEIPFVAATNIKLRSELVDRRAEVERLKGELEREREARKEADEALQSMANDLAMALGHVGSPADLVSEIIGRMRDAERERDELKRSAEMACQSPPEGCDCPGCSLADEVGVDRG